MLRTASIFLAIVTSCASGTCGKLPLCGFWIFLSPTVWQPCADGNRKIQSISLTHDHMVHCAFVLWLKPREAFALNCHTSFGCQSKCTWIRMMQQLPFLRFWVFCSALEENFGHQTKPHVWRVVKPPTSLVCASQGKGTLVANSQSPNTFVFFHTTNLQTSNIG